MLTFSKIEIENFCSFRSQTIDLTRKGVILILGENRDDTQADSNGSGKSLVFETFCWGLWGETVRGISGTDLVNKYSKKNTRVSIEFKDATNSYRVNRYFKYDRFKENDLELFINGVDSTKESMKSTQALITSIVGLDFSSFCYLMPGTKVKVSTLTDKGFKNLLEDFTNLHLFDKAHAVAKDKLKTVEAKVNQLNFELSVLQKQKEKNKVALATLEEKIRIADENLEKEISIVAAEIANYTPVDVVYLQEMVQFNKNGVAEAERRIIDSNITHKQSGVDYQAKFDKLLILENTYNAKLYALQTALASLNDLPDCCPTCKQEVDRDITSAEISKKYEDIQDLSSKIEKIVKSKTLLNNDYRVKITEHSNYVLTQQNIIKDFVNVIHDLSGQISEAARAQEHKIMCEKQLKYLRAAKQTNTNQMTEMLNNLAADDKEITAVIESLDEIKEQKEALDFWVDSFSPKGLRSYVLKQVTPFFNKRLLHYCNMLTNGTMLVGITTERQLKNGNTKDEFSISVVFKNGSECYAGCSEGEKARVDFVLSLALADLVKHWLNVQVPIRFYDEAFEKVDHAGLSAIVNMLHKDTENYDSVYVITHNQNLKEFFEQKLFVIKQNGESYVN